jgi:condensin complex subunit 1
MRMAMVEVMGALVKELSMSSEMDNDQTHAQKQLNGLYDFLLERTLDLSSYVRAKVFAVLNRLCDLPAKFPKQRLAVTQAAVDALQDKASTVRKAAIALLVKLIVTHPYGLMHGGLLGLEEWEERYKEVTTELKKVEEVVGKAVEREEGTPEGDDKEGADEDEEEDDEQEGEAEAGASGRKR